MFQFTMKRPRLFLALFTLLAFAAVTRGGFSDTDTHRRLQVTHWMWSAASQVAPEDRDSIPRNPTPSQILVAPNFCDLPGVNGEIYAQFSIGQSLLMLPADLAIGWLRGATRETTLFTWHDLFVNLTTFTTVAVVGALLSFELLLVLGFSTPAAVGATTLLVTSSTYILYMQDSSDTSQLYTLLVAGLVVLLKGRGDLRWNLLAAGACAGFGLLIRLPFLAEAATLAIVAKYVSDRARGAQWPAAVLSVTGRTVRDAVWFAAPVLVATAVDRAYQFYRFGEWTTTYMKQCVEAFARVGGFPADFPFGYPFLKGFLGPLIDPNHSIFLFDPFLIVAIVLVAAGWRGMRVERRLVARSAAFCLFLLCVIYGGSWYWNGGLGNWGARHHIAPVQLFVLLGFALAIERFAASGALMRAMIVAGGILGFTAQAIALPALPPVEHVLALDGDPLRFMQAIRVRNLYYLATGRPEAIVARAPADSFARELLQDRYKPSSPHDFYFIRVAKLLDPPDSWLFVGLWAALALTAFGIGLSTILRCFRREGLKGEAA